MTDVLFVASEMAPFSKTGGLADVAGALPKALAQNGCRVLAVSPRYAVDPEAVDSGLQSHVRLGGRVHTCRLFVLDRDGVRWVLVDHPCFHRGGIYGDETGAYEDNLFRYALLCRVAIDVGAQLPALDGQTLRAPIVHCNDWHTGLIPVFLKTLDRNRLPGARVVLGLHNLGHQGSVRRSAFGSLGLPGGAWPWLDMGGRLNPLKAGIVTADALVAVSPTYSRQIQSDQGFGLESVLRARKERLVGIVNGIGAEWDPSTDVHLPATYDADDLSGKAVCKATLQAELGLPVRDVPMFGMVSRLDPQKGIDLIQELTPWLLAQDVQLVMLGSGASRYEQFFRASERRWPFQARGWVGFSERLAHQIEAASDFFLMPSRFEPCGLNQLYSMRYGSVPIVHATGGLADTVTTASPGRRDATGWAFEPHSAESFRKAIYYALETYRQFPDAYAEIRRNGMTTDWSWARSAERYQAVYEATRSL